MAPWFSRFNSVPLQEKEGIKNALPIFSWISWLRFGDFNRKGKKTQLM